MKNDCFKMTVKPPAFSQFIAYKEAVNHFFLLSFIGKHEAELAYHKSK